MSTSRLTPITGVLALALGAAWLVPALAKWLAHEAFDPPARAVVGVGLALILGGVAALWRGPSTLRLGSIPAPARAAILGNGLLLALCAMETSDGLLRQGGRIFYWTSVLFFPALILFYGLVSARPWAWWMARVLTGLSTAWFIGFLVLIPVAPLRGSGGAIPIWGRFYMAGVTLVFAGISAYAFRSLGQREAREFYERRGA